MSNKISYFKNARNFVVTHDQTPIIKDVAEAYSIQKQVFVRDNESVAWKLGGVNKLTRKLFNVANVYAGPVAAHSVHMVTPHMQPIGLGKQLQGELELMVRVGSLDSWHRGQTNIEDLIVEIAPAIECPASALDFPNQGVLALIADCCAAGSVIHGMWNPLQKFANFKSNGDVSLAAEGNILAEGNYANLIGGLFDVIERFFVLCREHELQIRSGDYICTGGLTPCITLPANKILTANFEGFDEFSFVVMGDQRDR